MASPVFKTGGWHRNGVTGRIVPDALPPAAYPGVRSVPTCRAIGHARSVVEAVKAGDTTRVDELIGAVARFARA